MEFETIEIPACVQVAHEGRNYKFWGENQWLILRQLRALKTFYELELLEYLRGAVPNPDVIVDVGANIGNHTVYFSQVMQAQSVISLEPHHKCFDALGANCKENGCDNVTGLFCGASAVVERRFPDYCRNQSLPDQGYNVGATRFSAKKTYAQTTDVQFIPIDGILERASGNITLIKVDVEGMEMDVLRGATKTIRTQKPWIVIEIADRNTAPFQDQLRDTHTMVERPFNHTPTWVFKPNA